MVRGKLFVGTSGFAFKEWKGVFYPEGTSDKRMLSYYSTVLPSVEINYTFRRMPSESTIEGWRSQAVEGFQLSLKAPQRITHIKRLKDVQDDVDEFMKRVKGLGDRLGAVLFQCPPSLRYERDRLEAFLAALAPVAKFAMEFRHESWNDPEVSRLLSEANIALCGADTDSKSLDSVPATAKHVYMRLRKEEYALSDIAAWAEKIRSVLDEAKDVYCYFKHEGGGIGPQYAATLKEAVG